MIKIALWQHGNMVFMQVKHQDKSLYRTGNIFTYNGWRFRSQSAPAIDFEEKMVYIRGRSVFLDNATCFSQIYTDQSEQEQILIDDLCLAIWEFQKFFNGEEMEKKFLNKSSYLLLKNLI